MILGALLDAGLSEAQLKEQLARLHLPGFDIRSQRVVKQGISAVKADVLVADERSERRLADIRAVVQESDLADDIRTQAISIFDRLGQVEAEIHGIPAEQVHLHELGGLDTIVDVVGTLVGLKALEVTRVYASSVSLGGGFATGAHGAIPLPAPATLALLKDIPVVGRDLEMELVTPTGAVLRANTAHGAQKRRLWCRRARPVGPQRTAPAVGRAGCPQLRNPRNPGDPGDQHRRPQPADLRVRDGAAS